MDLSVEAFNLYLRSVRGKNTAKAYRQAANMLVQYVQEKRVDIHRTPGLLFGFQAWVIGRGLSPATLDVIMPGAMKYLEWRRANGDPIPVFAKPDKPRRNRPTPAVLRAAAMRQYVALTSSADEPFRTLALLYPFSGLRADEMCKLGLKQIEIDPGDPKRKRLRFSRVVGKSKAIRDVAIVDPGSSILYRYLVGWRRGVQGSPWLFPSEEDWQKPYNDRTMRRKMDDIEKAVGGPNLSARVLRHTWATALADAGIPMHHVARLAGHESIQTTYAHYIGKPTAETVTAELGKVDLLQKVEGTR